MKAKKEAPATLDQVVASGEKKKRTRAKPPEPVAGADGLLPRNKYEIFSFGQVNRDQLQNAPYNPRLMDEFTQTKLRDQLKKGQFKPIIWNKRTGNIVGGHQRVEQLDALHESTSYSLSVVIIDVDEAEERRINIVDNSDELTGQWDVDKLTMVLGELTQLNPDFQITDTGFEVISLDLMGVDASVLGVLDEEPAAKAAINEIDEIAKMKKLKGDHKQKDRKREAVLADAAVKARWLTLGNRAPTEKNPQRTLLEKHLSDYTTKNTADYFIHKDLGGFLRRELDF
jgi:hypothetical protein